MRRSAYREHISDGKPVSVDQFIDWIRQRHRTRNGIFGTKILHEDFQTFKTFPSFRDLFFSSRIIHLRRRSKLRQAISYFFAEETGQWVATDTPRKAVESVEYNYAAIRRHLDRLVRQDSLWTAVLDSLGIPYEELIFEEFLLDMSGKVARIAAFVGIDGGSLPIAATLAEQKNSLTAAFIQRFRSDLREHEFRTTGGTTYKDTEFV